MTKLMTRSVLLAAALVLALSGAGAAQDYPSRPITLVVPYAAGGGNDVMARIVAEKMSKSLGQQIVIENKGGAGGSIATRQVAKAAPDGYTLGLGGTGTLAINPTLYPNVGYDPRKDFAPVGLIATSALVVLVHPNIEAKSIAELIALAKREPGKLNYASAGSGSGIHLGTELLAHMAGIKLTGLDRSSRRARGDLSVVVAACDFAGEGGQGASPCRDRAEALGRFPRPADGRRDAARLRGRAALWHRGAGRYAATDHREAQRGACLGARRAGRARAHRGGWRRGNGDDAGRVRGRHRR
jgi:hypothetical protein